MKLHSTLEIEAGCHGANCGRLSKAPGSGHLPRRSKMTRHEKDDLMKAGGPGSGRHPGGGLNIDKEKLQKDMASQPTKNGWTVAKQTENSTQYKHPDFPAHRITTFTSGPKAGNWDHYSARSPKALGSGSLKDFSIINHLSDFHRGHDSGGLDLPR